MLDLRPDSAGNTFRARRFEVVRDAIERVLATRGACRVLDLGGTPTYWQTFGKQLDWQHIEVHLLNLTAPVTNHPRITSRIGDARDVSGFANNAFDIVFSNSVIEHVGRWSDMVRMAREVRRLAPLYIVQTPYFWFPIEPHARFPFLHWLPESWRYRIVMQRSCGYWETQADVGAAVDRVQSAALLDKRQMQCLFPDATIVSERVLGITKSLTAIRIPR